MYFAFNRLSLYEAAFGFTTLRVYSHAFILLLAAVYMSLLYKIFVDLSENAFALRTFFSIVIFIVAIHFLNPDLFIAQKNLERFSATGKIDYDYLSSLSPDATPVLLKIYEKANAEGKSVLSASLNSRSKEQDAWPSWNLSRQNERQLLRQYKI